MKTDMESKPSAARREEALVAKMNICAEIKHLPPGLARDICARLIALQDKTPQCVAPV